MFVAQMVVIKKHGPAFVRKKFEKNASGINSSDDGLLGYEPATVC